jgi:predicted ribosome quality control (RQC) complex YloA/Tae2 family protein
MAKYCINPNCGKEIPSSAIFCSFCGTQQIADGELTEEDKLRKELSETEETNKLLKKSLADAHDKIDIANKKNQELETLLANEQTKQKGLQNQVATKNKEVEQLKLLANKKGKNGGLIFFMIVFLFATVGLGGVCLNLNDKVNSAQTYYSGQQDELNTLQAQNKVLVNEKKKFQNEISKLNKKGYVEWIYVNSIDCSDYSVSITYKMKNGDEETKWFSRGSSINK